MIVQVALSGEEEGCIRGQDHNDPDIADGVGFSSWKLDFLTPASGMAPLIDQHVFGHYDDNERLPFTIVPLK